MQNPLGNLGLALILGAAAPVFSLPAHGAVLNTSFGYNVTSTDDGLTRGTTALVTRLDNFGVEKRPVVVLMPGWGGVGDVPAARDVQSTMFANNGYVALSIGFHNTAGMFFHSDLAESAKAALETLCVETYVDCTAVVLVGESYGGTQTHPVVRYLRASGVFDGSGGGNAGRKVVGMLGQDSGYTLYYAIPRDADATAYSIAMIQNLGDGDFPVDSCQFDNCGARNRADYHQAAAGNQYVLSYCHPGGVHGARNYADWDAWVLSAVKTMLHVQRGVPTFTGYVGPSVAVSNACVTTPLPPAPVSPAAPTIATATAGNASISVAFTPGAIGSGALVNHTADCGGVTNTGMSSPIVVGGLVNGTPYTCRVKTTSTVGDSSWSAFSNTATPVQPTVTFTLTVGKTGAGMGTVTSSPAGIDCGATCAAGFNSGTAVTLTAFASAGSTFGGWSGGGCTGTGGCTVTLNSAIDVTAIFGVAADPNPRRLANLSTRGQVRTGNDVMIGGFIIAGSSDKTVMVRARGPSLTAFGITNALANPTLQLARASDQAMIASNDDWGSAANAAQISASGFAPSNALESAILMTLAPGAYTAIVSGAGGGTGVGIVEMYEVDRPDVPFAGISTRGQVLTGNDVMIAGFVVQGSGPQTVVVRARGPSLGAFGIANALANPMLQLVRASDQVMIAANDDWQSASNAAQLSASGFAPSNSLESAILITLDPGAYTAIASGVGNTTGVAIVEVYQVP
jgi:dienelactone hydrolase